LKGVRARVWRLLDSGPGEGWFNMAVDEALLLCCGPGKQPVVRFYGWRPAAVSVGYGQDVQREVDVAACRRWGLDIVRRPTGGRGVLHEAELTYAVVWPQDLLAEGILGSYRQVAEGLVAGLRELGVTGELVEGRHGRRGGRTAACFLAPSWYEVVVGGRKIVGSAQRRLKMAVLQQGSLLLNVDYEKLVEVFPGRDGREAELERARAKVTGLEVELGRRVDVAEVKECMTCGFEQVFGIRLESGELTAEEAELASRLAEEKYRTEAWNLARKG